MPGFISLLPRYPSLILSLFKGAFLALLESCCTQGPLVHLQLQEQRRCAKLFRLRAERSRLGSKVDDVVNNAKQKKGRKEIHGG